MATDTGIELKNRALWGVTLAGLEEMRGVEDVVGVAFAGGGEFYSHTSVWNDSTGSAHITETDVLVPAPGVNRYANIALQPQGAAGTTTLMSDIAAGVYDAKYNELFTGLAAKPWVTLLRWGHEANGNWYTWAPSYTQHVNVDGITLTHTDGGAPDAASYKAAWNHIYDLIGTLGFHAKIKMWFCCAQDDASDGKGLYPGAMELIAPDATKVDYIGLDVYPNISTPTTTLASPTQLIEPMYDRLMAVPGYSTKDVLIGEIGVHDPTTGTLDWDGVPASGAKWITALGAVTKFSKLRWVFYFSVNKASSGRKDWRFQSSTAKLTAAQTLLQSIASQTALTDGHGVLPHSVLPAPAFTPEAPTALAVATDLPWTELDGRSRRISSMSYWLNKVISYVGGLAGLVGTSDGSVTAGKFVTTLIGSAGQAILRIESAAAGTKRALETRVSGDTVGRYGVDVDGKTYWGVGGSTSLDTTLARNAAAELITNAALTLDGTATAPTSNPTGSGVKIYADGGALKIRVATLGASVLTRKQGFDYYSGGIILNADPLLATALITPPAGFVHLARLDIGETKALTKIGVEVTTVGTGLTAGQCFLAIYDSTGVLLGVTTDTSTTLTTAGVRTGDLVTPFTIAPGSYRVAYLVNGTTPPVLRGFPVTGSYNLTGYSQRWVRAGGSALTTMPSPVVPGSVSGTAPSTYLCHIV